MSLKSIWDRSWKVVSDASTAYGLLPSTIATGVVGAFWTIGAMIAGVLQGVPVMWIMVGITAIAALTFQYLNQFNQWRFEQGVAHKIAHNQIRWGLNLADNGALHSVVIGFDVVSRANFPIDLFVDSIETNIGASYPQRLPFINRNFKVPAAGVVWFHDHAIDVTPAMYGAVSEGELFYRIKYGKNGELAFFDEKRFRLYLNLDPVGRLLGTSFNELSTAPTV